MILVIDIGNIDTTLGVFAGEALIKHWRITTHSGRTSDEIGMNVRNLFHYSNVDMEQIEAVVLSSVVPNVMYSFLNAIRKYLKIEPIEVKSGMKTGINLRMENPKEMGSDRIAKLAAVYALYGGPAMVIDYSTATTFDVINEKGEFLTGVTAPGVQICADALISRTARLPRFAISMPDSIYTKNTVESMQAGLVLSHIGETKYMISRIQEELGIENMKIIATGGFAKTVDQEGDIFDAYVPTLSLEGLRILYEKNYGKRKKKNKQ